MKVTITELRKIVEGVLAEAKKKKEKADALKAKAGTAGSAYGSYAEVFDYSAPLGGYNLYKTQGAVNWGPMTSPGSAIDDRVNAPAKLKEEKMLRGVIGSLVREALVKESAWDLLELAAQPPRSDQVGNFWEMAIRKVGK